MVLFWLYCLKRILKNVAFILLPVDADTHMLSLPGCLRVVYIRCVIADKCWHETETLRVWMDVAYKPAQNEVSERGWTCLWAVSPPHHLWVGSPFTPLMCGAAIKDTEAQRAAHPLPAVQLHPQLFLLPWKKVLWFQTGCYRPACGIRTERLCMSVCVCVSLYVCRA